MNVYHSVSISVGTNSKFLNIPSNYLNSSKVWIVDKASYWFIYWEYTSTKRILDSIHFRQPKFNSSQWNWGLYQICKLTFCQTYTENLQFANPSFYQTFILPTLQITKYQICKLTFRQTNTEIPSMYPPFILPILHFVVTLRTSNLML